MSGFSLRSTPWARTRNVRSHRRASARLSTATPSASKSGLRDLLPLTRSRKHATATSIPRSLRWRHSVRRCSSAPPAERVLIKCKTFKSVPGAL